MLWLGCNTEWHNSACRATRRPDRDHTRPDSLSDLHLGDNVNGSRQTAQMVRTDGPSIRFYCGVTVLQLDKLVAHERPCG
jgi:hypothetical protein